MKKKRIILFLAMILALAIAGCNDKKENDVEVSGDVVENETAAENETVTGKEETQKTETDNKKDDTSKDKSETNKNQTDKNESTSNQTPNKNNTTSNKNETTTKPSTGSNNTGSTTKPSTGSTGSTNSGSTNNSGNTGNTSNNNGGTTTQPSAPVHEHKWTEVTEDEIHYYAWRTLCGKCKADLTDMTEDDRLLHVVVICNSRYSTNYIEVDFVTENVVKIPVVTGYKCECGATKNK